jgi:hypothetical protein
VTRDPRCGRLCWAAAQSPPPSLNWPLALLPPEGDDNIHTGLFIKVFRDYAIGCAAIGGRSGGGPQRRGSNGRISPC